MPITRSMTTTFACPVLAAVDEEDLYVASRAQLAFTVRSPKLQLKNFDT